jgi:hypothetical protein
LFVLVHEGRIDQRHLAARCWRSGPVGDDILGLLGRAVKSAAPATLAMRPASSARRDTFFLTSISFHCLGDRRVGGWIRRAEGRRPSNRRTMPANL